MDSFRKSNSTKIRAINSTKPIQQKNLMKYTAVYQKIEHLLSSLKNYKFTTQII